MGSMYELHTNANEKINKIWSDIYGWYLPKQ